MIVPSRRVQGRERTLLLPHAFNFSIGCENRGRISGYPYSLQFRRISDLSCSAAPESTTYYLSSGFIEDGAGNDQTLKASGMWLCPFL